MKSDRQDLDMKCPKCGRFSLKGSDVIVVCGTCGYELSPGEATKFRLYRLLKSEEKRAK